MHLFTHTLHTPVADFDPHTGVNLAPVDPWLCFATNSEDHAASGAADDAAADDTDDGDADDDTDDSAADDKRFSAADIERAIKRRLTKTAREHQKSAKAAERKTAELEAALADLQEKLEAGSSGDAKKASANERALTKASARVSELTEQVTALTSERDGASGSLKSYIIQDKLRAALMDAKVLPSALKHAVSLMANEMQAELLEEDNSDGTKSHVVVVKVKGAESDDLDDAARKWLKSNGHFAAHPGGGAGTAKPTGGGNGHGRLSPELIEKSNAGTLIERGLAAALGAKTPS